MLAMDVVSSSSALLHDEERSSAEVNSKKRWITKSGVIVTVLGLIILVGAVIGTQSMKKSGVDLAMKVGTGKQGPDAPKNLKDETNPSINLDGGLYGCGDGKYLAGGKKCFLCPKGCYCKGGVKKPCKAGTYQDKKGQSYCKLPGCGFYVPTSHSPKKFPCQTGFYQRSDVEKAKACTPAQEGYFVKKDGKKCRQKKCAKGYYQDCKGQGKCMEAPCGHKVSGTGATKPTKCGPGWYQNKRGQSECLKAEKGHFALRGACHHQKCKPGYYQDERGQSECKKARCGHKVNKVGAEIDTPCPKKTWQQGKGSRQCVRLDRGFTASADRCSQTACTKGKFRVWNQKKEEFVCKKADCGHYVPTDGATEQLKCPKGTWQKRRGKSSCDKVPAGKKPKDGRCGIKPCPPGTFKRRAGPEGGDTCKPCRVGTFQSKPGQIKCLAAPCGYFVYQTGARKPIPCEEGTFQPLTKQSSCRKAKKGSYAPGGECGARKCKPGTYTDEKKQARCKKADCGYHVPNAEGKNPERCSHGEYQPVMGQSSCLKAPKGSVPNQSQCGVVDCPTGEYQPGKGKTTCIKAACGYYVPHRGSHKQYKCPEGRYATNTGNTKCKKARKGQYVDPSDQCQVKNCEAGWYTDCEAQSECLPAPCGHSSKDRKTYKSCKAGEYQPRTGQTKCELARPGRFTDGKGYCFDEACEVGTYQEGPGGTKCLKAKCGEYVDKPGQRRVKYCSPGTYQPMAGQSGCLPTTKRLAPNPKTCKTRKMAKCWKNHNKRILSGVSLNMKSALHVNLCKKHCQTDPKCKCWRFKVGSYQPHMNCKLYKRCTFTTRGYSNDVVGECGHKKPT